MSGLVPTGIGAPIGNCECCDSESLPDLYVWGGSIPNNNGYFIAGNTWDSFLNLTGATDEMGGAKLGTKLYATSGNGSNAHREYDKSLNTWTTRAVKPNSNTRAPRSAVAGGRLHCMGGRDNAGAITTREFNDSWVSDTWTARAAIPDPKRAGSAIFELGGTIYYTTGHTTGPTPVATTAGHGYTFDSWASMAAITAFRVYPAFAADGTFGYVQSGEDAYSSVVFSNANRRYVVDTWSSGAVVPAPSRGGPSACSVAGLVYHTNGYNFDPGPLTYYQDHDRYDAGLNAWTARTNSISTVSGSLTQGTSVAA